MGVGRLGVRLERDILTVVAGAGAGGRLRWTTLVGGNAAAVEAVLSVGLLFRFSVAAAAAAAAMTGCSVMLTRMRCVASYDWVLVMSSTVFVVVLLLVLLLCW